jgi:alkylation response protein AidB-like acyl-CoA dehydrogenase
MVPEQYGGGGARDFRFNAVLIEELTRARASGVGFSIHTDINSSYLLDYATDEQKARWLPGFCSGETITAIAMTEPGAGSDLQGIRTTAIRDGDSYLLNGQKTFISNGILADLVIVVAKTDPDAGSQGISLLVVERGTPGFERGRNLDKIGLKAQDTAELFFDDVRVPATNLLGQEGQGFVHLMEKLPQERLAIAVVAAAACENVLEATLAYVKERTAFGRPIGSFQNSRFVLAELATETQIARVFVDRCIEELNAGTLSVSDAAMAKWWTTELQQKVVDRCLCRPSTAAPPRS